MVDAGFTADTRIDLGHQRGGDLHERNAAQIGRRGESCEIPDHPAAQGDQRCQSLASSPNQEVENPVQPLHGLRHFAFRYHDQTDIETFRL